MYVRTYVGTLTVLYKHLPECPFDFSAVFVQWYYTSCSIHCTSTCTVRLLLYMSTGCLYKATKIEKHGWAVSAEIKKQVCAYIATYNFLFFSWLVQVHAHTRVSTNPTTRYCWIHAGRQPHIAHVPIQLLYQCFLVLMFMHVCHSGRVICQSSCTSLMK